MKQAFITKPNANGVRYSLVIDHESKQFERGYNPRNYTDYVTITEKARKTLCNDLEKAGYTHVDRIYL